jgi:hypothetical protein
VAPHNQRFFYSARKKGGTVQVGAQTRNSEEDGSDYMAVLEQNTHPNNNDRTEEFDFMVLKLGGWVGYLWLHDINAIIAALKLFIVSTTTRLKMKLYD